jgi:glutaredoxin 3
MSQIDIYSSMFCPFCHRAKTLLASKGAEFNEIDVDRDPNARMEMMRRANGGRTVPQIFIDDQHVGGSDDLAALERAGELDAMLA